MDCFRMHIYIHRTLSLAQAALQDPLLLRQKVRATSLASSGPRGFGKVGSMKPFARSCLATSCSGTVVVFISICGEMRELDSDGRKFERLKWLATLNVGVLRTAAELASLSRGMHQASLRRPLQVRATAFMFYATAQGIYWRCMSIQVEPCRTCKG